VKNIKKLVRKFIPKRADISQCTENYIQMVQDILNNKPRKYLKGKTS